MKKKNIADLRNKTVAELEKLAAELSVRPLSKSKNTNLVKNLKIDLARVLTIKNQKIYEKS